MIKVMTGNEAIAQGVCLARPQMITYFPITPQTSIMESLIVLQTQGKLKARMTKIESEHSALASLIGAASAGCRAFTATASQGLALMHEMLHWTAGARLPIVLVNVNRALAAPWILWSDQSDSLSQRDTGWLQLYTSTNQEALDTAIQAFKIAEQVLLPVMVILDGFYLSHVSEPVDVPAQKAVDSYLPPYKAPYALNVEDPREISGVVDSERYFQLRYRIQQAMDQAKKTILREGKEFNRCFGRKYGLTESYRLKNATRVLVTSGTISGTAKEVVDHFRKKGKKIGLLRIRSFRPFPREEVRRFLADKKWIAVIDRNVSLGSQGIFCEEVKASLFNINRRSFVYGFIAGLGGVDVPPGTVSRVVELVESGKASLEESNWIM